MFVKTFGSAVYGVNAYTITIEVNVSGDGVDAPNNCGAGVVKCGLELAHGLEDPVGIAAHQIH